MVVARLQYHEVAVDHFVDKAVLEIDSSRPTSGQVPRKSLRFAAPQAGLPQMMGTRLAVFVR